MTDPTHPKKLCGKRDDKTNSKYPAPKKIMSVKMSDLVPPTPTATTAPTFPRPDGFAAGKKMLT